MNLIHIFCKYVRNVIQFWVQLWQGTYCINN